MLATKALRNIANLRGALEPLVTAGAVPPLLKLVEMAASRSGACLVFAVLYNLTVLSGTRRGVRKFGGTSLLFRTLLLFTVLLHICQQYSPVL